MKVALIIDFWFPAVGGGQINSWEISKRITNKKMEIDIITKNCGNDNLEKIPNLRIYKLGPKTRPDNIFSEFYFLFKLFSFVLSRDYDLIHVHPFLPALPAKLLSMLKNIPIIITVHGTRLFEGETKTLSRLLEKYILTGIRYDTQISVTKAFTRIKNVNKKITVIPNGIDTAKFDKLKVAKFPRPTILWVGRFDPVKRVEDLIVATKKLNKKIKTLQVILAGYGYHQESLKQKAKDLNLKNIRFVGLKTGDELIALYKKSHVFVLPSSSEGQPLTILEAHAASLPVVAANVGGVPEIVEDKRTGLLVPPKNPQKLAAAILSVLKNEASFGQNGHEFAKNFYSWEKAAKQTLKVYGSFSKS